MRTQEEIVERIKEKWDGDFLGFETSDLLTALTFSNVQQFLKKDHDITADSWRGPKTGEYILKEMKAYFDFAHEKATYHRGISASRSVAHFRSWLWLLGEDELLAFVDDEGNYQQYGAPIIKKLADHYGVELPIDEDFDAMAVGDICPSCKRGDTGGCGQ